MSAPSRRLRVLVVDDHDVVHWGLRTLLGELPWVERCLSASDGDEAVALARQWEPDVALVDLFVGHQSGADICEQVRSASPATRVLFISGAGRLSPAAARAAGAAGFIPKDRGARELAAAIHAVGSGATAFTPSDEQPVALLSDREHEVLEGLAGGSTNREIADSLFLSPHTVKEHTSTLYRKLGARNRTDAVQRAQRLGLIS